MPRPRRCLSTARAARADFHLGTKNCGDVVALVRALQGMPLAIELAAARVRSFSPHDMAQRLQPDQAIAPALGSATPSLDLLARGGPRGGRDARHASLQSTIAWSWQLLSAEEQALLCWLTLFRGGCSAAAVRALAWPDDGAAPAPNDPAADEHHLRRVRRLAARQIDAQRMDQAWAEGAGLGLAAAVALALGPAGR